MNREKNITTPGTRELMKCGVSYEPHPYRYEEKGGSGAAARELNVDEHLVIKTLVMEDSNGRPFLMLAHGDQRVSTKALSRALGVKTVKPCEPQTAYKHTGYYVGGISPFGTKNPLDIYVESSVLNLERIYINAGKKGLLVEIAAKDLEKILKLTPVKAAV